MSIILNYCAVSSMSYKQNDTHVKDLIKKINKSIITKQLTLLNPAIKFRGTQP